MPARAPYIPRAQGDFDLWARNFADTVAKEPELYALTPADAEKIRAVVDRWHAAYTPVTCKGNRTQCLVRTKDEAREAARESLRGYAQRITHCPEVSAGAKIALKVNPGRLKWTRIAAPPSHPCLWAVDTVTRGVKIRFCDSHAVEHAGAKPYGCVSCQVFYTLSDERIERHSLLTAQHTATRSPFVVDFPDAGGGRQCYMAGYWLMRNGKRGGWGPIASFTVPRSG